MRFFLPIINTILFQLLTLSAIFACAFSQYWTEKAPVVLGMVFSVLWVEIRIIIIHPHPRMWDEAQNALMFPRNGIFCTVSYDVVAYFYSHQSRRRNSWTHLSWEIMRKKRKKPLSYVDEWMSILPLLKLVTLFSDTHTRHKNSNMYY